MSKPKGEIREIVVSSKELRMVSNITVDNPAFSAQLSKYLTTWMAAKLEKYQEEHGPVEKSSMYQTYADTQAPNKTGRKIQQEKKDKDGTKKMVDVSPKAYFTNLNNLKIFLNYFLIKYALELRYIFKCNEYEFGRDYNEAELEKDAFDLILNPLIPFVLHVGRQFDSKSCEYTLQFEGMNSVKQIFKNEDNGQASSKKIDQFMNSFLNFVNVLVGQIYTISFPRKALLHIDYIIGLLDVFNQSADLSALGKDVLDDLSHYLKNAIKKPVKGTGKKTGKKAGAAAKKVAVEEEEEETVEDEPSDEDIDDTAEYDQL